MALADEAACLEPSVTALLATASGMALFGPGATFWGVVFGLLAYALRSQPAPAA